MEGLYEVTNALSIFWVTAIFLLPVSPLRPPRRPFLLIFARTAQQSVLDGTNRVSGFKPCACRIVHREDIFAIAQFLLLLLCVREQSVCDAVHRGLDGRNVHEVVYGK